jgi:signal transduction histidine kinase
MHGSRREFEGNGLGLALIKKYCELNNAEIAIESKKSVGTKFTVTFSDQI